MPETRPDSLRRPVRRSRGRHVRRCRSWLSALIVVAFLLVGTSCNASGEGAADQAPDLPQLTPSPGAPPRQYLMGFSSVPAERTEASYRAAFSTAGSYGELVMIPRAVPWDEFRPGGTISDRTRDVTRAETALAEDVDVDLLISVDPLSPVDRGRLAGLPERMRGMTFQDEEVRKAFVTFAKYVALNYKPRYLALGVDVDMYYDANPEDFAAFRDAYFGAYDAAKEASPETQVFVTFQLESIMGMLPADGAHEPRWDLVSEFLPKLDVLAVSTYPGFAFSSVAEIPESYYLQLADRAEGRPIGIAGVGFSSSSTADGAVVGSEEQQQAFLTRLFADADRLNTAFVIWYTSRDPAFELEAPFDLYAAIGLQRRDGTPKPAWNVWLQQAGRPTTTPGPAAVSEGGR